MAVELYKAMTRNPGVEGNRIVGYVSVNNSIKEEGQAFTNCLGTISEIREIVKANNIEEVIIATDLIENQNLAKVVNGLMGLNVVVKAIPGLYDHLLGRVKVSSIYGIPLMQVSLHGMPLWQEILKLSLDKIISSIAVICLIPIYLILSIVVKATSKGPVFFCQERVGRYGKPFVLYKFRTMVPNAEVEGPALSSKSDERVTSVGRFMRKTRLDELPNFFNVLKGDLSIVGPRPERQFFIDQIVEKAPHYLQLLRVKPGITSWGQVKYGYAENVDQMIERLEFDLLYLENMSLLVDFRIMVYTIITVLRGRGV
jgi:exopolysaccharide biosynthesis polyprenyl glycosylphosphotransferase